MCFIKQKVANIIITYLIKEMTCNPAGMPMNPNIRGNKVVTCEIRIAENNKSFPLCFCIM